MSLPDMEPEPVGCTFTVGQDIAGHWLVQGSRGKLEGRFVSIAAAMAFARRERHASPGAIMALAIDPIAPAFSFAPVQPWETAARYRAAA